MNTTPETFLLVGKTTVWSDRDLTMILKETVLRSNEDVPKILSREFHVVMINTVGEVFFTRSFGAEHEAIACIQEQANEDYQGYELPPGRALEIYFKQYEV